MKNTLPLLSVFILLLLTISTADAGTCRASGRIKGTKPPRTFNHENQSECCKQGKYYTTYNCSPSVSRKTKAILTLNSFQKGGDDGGPSACDSKYHSDKTPVVALSTGWFSKGKRCNHYITIHAKGRSVRAKVVDHCDSTVGCDSEHAYQPPCPNNIVDASAAVWKALGVPKKKWGWVPVTWSE